MLQINLLPWRQLRRQRRSRYWLWLFTCVPAVVFTGAVCLAVVMTQETTLLQRHLSALNSGVQQLSRQQIQVAATLSQVNVLRAERLLNRQRVEKSRYYLRLLGLLAAQIPGEVWLTELTEHQGLLTLKGEGHFYHDILAFSETLSTSGLLDEVSLSDVQQQPDLLLNFSVKAQLRLAKSLPETEGVQ